ncbi:hypothetical protein ACHAWF_003565 [Thalassiosira exigua]
MGVRTVMRILPLVSASAAAAAFLPPPPRRCVRGGPATAASTDGPAAAAASSSGRTPSPSSSTALRASLLETPTSLVRRGMTSFRDGDVPSSLSYFDRADASVPDGSLRPYLWQRGISYYYLDSFEEGSEQFRLDVSVNPLDVEEIVWDAACRARLENAKGRDRGGGRARYPPEGLMALPERRKDRRRIMGTVYSLFRGDGATERDLMTAGMDGNVSDEFYALFYLGLYCEVRDEPGKAEAYMTAAARSTYATGRGADDYMTSCARVHCRLRGWDA